MKVGQKKGRSGWKAPGFKGKHKEDASKLKKTSFKYDKSLTHTDEDFELVKDDGEPMISGECFRLITEYFQSKFEETLVTHTTVWNTSSNHPGQANKFLYSCISSLHEYYTDTVNREWTMLMEAWHRRKHLYADQVITVHQIVKDLNDHLKRITIQKRKDLKFNTLYFNTDYKDTVWEAASENGERWPVGRSCHEDSEGEEFWGEGERRSCWDLQVQRVRKHITIQHEKLGRMFVPKCCKVRIPGGEDGHFADLEIGIDWKGNPIVVKYLKTTCPVADLAAAVSKVRKVRHKHLLSCYMSPGPHCILATPLMDYNLGQFVLHLSRTGNLHQEAFRITRQIAEGVHALHSYKRPIIHGNLKPTNIFIDSSTTVKIGEYGLNLDLNSGSQISSSYSLIWKCSEQITGQLSGRCAAGSAAGDVASAGMLIHFVMSGGNHPFGVHFNEIIANIKGGAYELTTSSPVLRDLLVTMMAAKPRKRPTMEQVIGHIFWWPKKTQWQLVEACSSQSQCGIELRSFIRQQVANFWVNNDKAILSSKGGLEETKEQLLQWLHLLETEPTKPSTTSLKKKCWNLPLHLYRLLVDTKWANSSLLHQFFPPAANIAY